MILIGLALCTVDAAGQNTYPWPSTGKVGIGTTAPGYLLDVNSGSTWGTGRFTSGATDTSLFMANTTAGGHNWYMQSSGTGTGSPGGPGSLAFVDNSDANFEPLVLTDTVSYFNGLTFIYNAPNQLTSLNISNNVTTSASFLTFYNSSHVQYNLEEGGPNVSGDGNQTSAHENTLFITTPTNSKGVFFTPFVVNENGDVGLGGVPMYNGNASGTITGAAMVVSTALGNRVGIGTSNPSQTLEVNGTAQFDGTLQGNSGPVQIGTTGISFGGTAQTTAWTGVLCGGDYAESVDVTGDRTSYKPGDVLVIDPATPGKFLKSDEPYSTLVTGVYSTDPGVIGRRQKTPKSADEVPMAMIGIVPTRVSAENGEIHPGDLLVTASTMGYAMRGTDRSRMLGAVIGKALGNLESGSGVIEVAVTLQ